MPVEAQNAIGPVFHWVPSEDDPVTNTKIILTHVAFKGAQTGSILNTLALIIIRRGRVPFGPYMRAQLVSTVATSMASVAAGFYMIQTSDPIRNYDRAYRLQYNSMQNRCDKYSVMFGGATFLASFWIWPPPLWVQREVIQKIAGFTCFGVGLGAVSHYITKNGPGNLDPINLWRK